jgi:hypothetical protein
MGRRLDDDRATHYAMLMLDKVEFPASVLITPGSRARGHDVGTGIHRLVAKTKAEINSTDAYLVTESGAYRRELLIRKLNTIEGHGTSVHEDILHVVMLKHEHPELSLPTLCKEWGLKLATVSSIDRAERCRSRARSMHFDLDRHKVSQITCEALANIHSDRVFAAAVQFVIDYNVTSGIVQELARELKTIRSDDDAIDKIIEYCQNETEKVNHAQAVHGKTPTSPASKMLGDAKRFNNLIAKGLDHLYLESLTSPGQARLILTDVVANAKRIIAELDRIAALKNPKKPSAAAAA